MKPKRGTIQWLAPHLSDGEVQAIYEAVREVIGEDAEPLWNDDEYDNLWCQDCDRYQDEDGECWCKPKNDLRAEQRKELSRLFGKETE